jgi:hypothetical protein
MSFIPSSASESGLRYLYPIGPAPKGWNVIPGCSRSFPHDDESEQWMNDEMNQDHYE